MNMNFTETEAVGGIGVAIMMHKTDLRQAIEAQSAALARMTEPLQKLASANDRLQKLNAGDTLKKNTSAYLEEHVRLEREALAALNVLAAPIAELKAATERAARAMPAFEKWALGQHAKTNYTTMIADKTFDSGQMHGETTDDAVKRGALAPFSTPNAPPRDLGAEASDAMLRHRPDVGGQ
jgi:hypothetical protein